MISKLKYTFSTLLYIVTCLVIFGSVNWICSVFLTWFAGAIMEKQLVVFLMLGSMIWMLFKALRNLLVNFSFSIGISKNLAVIIIFIFSIGNGCILMEYIWAILVKGHFKQILPGIFLTLLIIEITLSPLQDVPGLLKPASKNGDSAKI